jgi:hypothetical protein
MHITHLIPILFVSLRSPLIQLDLHSFPSVCVLKHALCA